MSRERSHTAKVMVIDGHVFIALPDDQFIKLTPEQARQMGARLFREAALALGEAPPSMVIINQEQS